MKKLIIIPIALLLAGCSFLGAKRDITLTNLTDYSVQGIYNQLSQDKSYTDVEKIWVEGFISPRLPNAPNDHNWTSAQEMVRAKKDGQWIYFAYDEKSGKVVNYEWPFRIKRIVK